jgi:MFS family permease
MFLVAAAGNAFGFGAVQPALQSLVMKSVPPERRGSASSTNYIGMDSATLVGPIVAGVVAQAFGYPAMWLVMILPSIIGVVFVIAFRNNINRLESDFRSRINETANVASCADAVND